MTFSNFQFIVPGHSIYYIDDDIIKEVTVVDIDKENDKIWIMVPGIAKCFDFDYSLSSNGYFYPSKISAQMQLYKMKQQKETLKDLVI